MYNTALKAAAFTSVSLSLNLFASPVMEYCMVPSVENPELLKLGKILLFFLCVFFVRERESQNT